MKNEKTIIKLGDNDVAIVVKSSGKSQVFIPFRNKGENKLTAEQLRRMLKEIRTLELAFTEIVNQTFVPETDEEKELFE